MCEKNQSVDGEKGNSNDVFFFKQKTAYEIGTGDWSSDVCSSDLTTKDNQAKKIQPIPKMEKRN